MRKTLCLVAIQAAANGCTKSVSRPDRSALVSPVVISLQEELPSRALVLDCRTEHEYGCFNFALDASLSRSSAGIKVDFRDVTAPDICLTAIGPARARLRLGTLDIGGHAVQFRTPLGVPPGWLEVTGNRYVLVASPNQAVRIETSQLRRIPDGTIWGMFGYARADLEPVVRGIRDEIIALGATPRLLPEGRYHVALADQQEDRFLAETGGQIVYDSPNGYSFTLPYAFEFHGDLDALRQIVTSVGHEHGDAIHLRVFTSQGEHLYSWVLGRG